MARIILIQEDDYERQYLESINYLNSKYHDQPTRLKNIQHANLGENYGQGKGKVNHPRSTPLGKLVI